MSSGSVHESPEASFQGLTAIGKYLPVANHTVVNQVALAAAVSSVVVGFAQTATTAAGELVTVRTKGYSLALAGTGGWTRGEKLTPDTAGVLIATSTATDKVCAIAEDTVLAGEYGEVRIIAPAVRYDTF
jgi:hypothetical protein